MKNVFASLVTVVAAAGYVVAQFQVNTPYVQLPSAWLLLLIYSVTCLATHLLSV